MAIIKKTKLKFQGSWHYVNINCNSEGKFFAELPDYIAADLGINIKVWGDTLIECEKNYQAAVDEHGNVTDEKTKVILYSLNNPVLIEPKGCEINMWACVCIERKVMLNGKFRRYTYEPVESSIPKRMSYNSYISNYSNARCGRHESLIEWTQEREDFFIDLGNKFESMMDGIKAFQQPDNLIKLISNNQKLLSDK